MYLTDLFRRLGIADHIKSKLRQTATGVFVGSIIASGEVEIGFQQVSELAHYPGIDYVGPLPADIQNVTAFSSGMQIGARSVDPAKAWITLLISPAAAFRSKSMDARSRRGRGKPLLAPLGRRRKRGASRDERTSASPWRVDAGRDDVAGRWEFAELD